MKKQGVFLFIAIVLIAAFSVRGASSLDAARKKYKTGVDALDGKVDKGRQAALDQYLSNLKLAEAAVKKRGDLDNLLAIRKEVKRFESTKKMDAAAAGSPIVDAVQAHYNSSLDALKENKRKSSISLSKKWIAYLGKLQKQLTREGNVDDGIQFCSICPADRTRE
jgi:hypothetical protein